MPYKREGAMKVSDHWVRSPLLNVARSCQACHPYPETEILARVEAIQDRTKLLLDRSGAALIDLLDAIAAAKKSGRRRRGARAGLRAAAEGAVAARLRGGGELDGVPRAAGDGAGARRGDRLCAAGRARGQDGRGTTPQTSITRCRWQVVFLVDRVHGLVVPEAPQCGAIPDFGARLSVVEEQRLRAVLVGGEKPRDDCGWG